MTVYEQIKATARKNKNISITTLEKTLGYSNGSLAKAKDIPCSRIINIAEFLETTPNLLLGFEQQSTASEVITLFNSIKKEQQEAVLLLLRSIAQING